MGFDSSVDTVVSNQHTGNASVHFYSSVPPGSERVHYSVLWGPFKYMWFTGGVQLCEVPEQWPLI